MFLRSSDLPRRRLAVLLLLGVTFLLDLASIRHRSATYDEHRHLRYGRDILHQILDRSDNSKMPVTSLNALPESIAGLVTWPESVRLRLSALSAARSVTVFFSLSLAAYVYHWAKELYGPAGGLLSLFLYAFSPNLIAHSGLVTTDLYATCFITIATYHFWRFVNVRGFGNAILSAFTLGLSQLAKYTCILLYPIFALILLVRSLPWSASRFPGLQRSPGVRSAWRGIGEVTMFASVSVLAINLGFLGHRSMTPLGEYKFRSTLFQTIQANAGPLRSTPVPVPYPYLEGLDWVYHDERAGSGSGNVYLLGEIRPSTEGFKGYFLYAFLFKEPLAFQALLAAALYAYWRSRRRRRFLDDEIFLLGPVLCFGIFFNLFFRDQIGFRFFLIVLPFLHVFCGSLVREWESVGARQRWLLSALGVYLVVSVLSYFPHYLSYFNELVWDRKMAYRVLADSNLDWGQGRWYLDQYRREHPEAVIEPAEPTSGEIVVGVNQFVGVFRSVKGVPGRAKYRWLREHFLPVGHVAYCYLVFHVTPEALQSALGERAQTR